MSKRDELIDLMVNAMVGGAEEGERRGNKNTRNLYRAKLPRALAAAEAAGFVIFHPSEIVGMRIETPQ